jgi:hypothetical protein
MAVRASRKIVIEKTSSPQKTTSKSSKTKAERSSKIALTTKKSWHSYLNSFQINTSARAVILLVIIGIIFIFSPQVGLLNRPVDEGQVGTQVYKIDIRSRTLSDPKEGDLKIKAGRRSLLQVTTDEDGRVDLVSEGRDVFNPVFSNVGNTLSIPTDRAESFRIEFHPVNVDNKSSNGIAIGTVIVQN